MANNTPPHRPLIERIQGKPLFIGTGCAAGAVDLISNFTDFPSVTRWQAYAVLACVFTFLATATFSTSLRVVINATVNVTLIAVLLLISWPDLSEKPSATGQGGQGAGDQHRARYDKIDLSSEPRAIVHGFGMRWVLHTDGRVVGLDAGGVVRRTFQVPGPAADIAICGADFVVTYANGYIGRFSSNDFRLLSHNRPGWGSTAIACGADSVFTNKPGAGSVVQFDAHRFRSHLEIKVGLPQATSIEYGGAAIWVADETGHEVVGVDKLNQRLGPIQVMPGPTQLLYAGGFLWVLHGDQSCLMRIDLARGEEIGPGVPVGPDPAGMVAHDGVIYVVDMSDRTLRQVDAHDGTAVGKALRVPGSGRLVDVEEHAGTITVVDKTNDRLIAMDRAEQAALVMAAPVHTRRRAGCPATAE